MSDRVEISNLALSKIGEDDQLLDPYDDTKAARTIAAVWNVVRDTVLRAHLWNFAMMRATLTAALPAPQFGFSYRFPLPVDLLRLEPRFIEPFMLEQDYQIEAGKNLLCDQAGPIYITYVRRAENPGDWDALFVEAFACRLAWQICDRLTGDRARKSDAWQAYAMAMREAKAVDGRENPPEPPRDTSWATSRYSRGGGHNGYPTKFY